MPEVAVSNSEDPLVSFNFTIEVQGELTGSFMEVSGLGSEHEVVEHKIMENGQEVVKKLPGRMKWENITLKRGITSNMDIWNWRKQVEQGNYVGARRNGSIVMYDSAFTEVARWNFNNGWPVKVSGPQPKTDSNEVGVEEMIIAHEGIERVS
jgi:phage tail-like protein